jgi:XTP/dITP diphosphohydrolase
MNQTDKLTLLAATYNAGKAREIKDILAGLPIEVITLTDLESYWQKQGQRALSANEIKERYAAMAKDMEETAQTFAGNALIKARGACLWTGLPTLADDSGLEVDYLQGAPGVYSARFSGVHGDDEANNALLLEKLKGVPDEKRRARFVAALALVDPLGGEYTARGVCEGFITHEPVGEHGFGYDPIFRLAGDNRTLAQFLPEEKNAVSHRAQALKKMVPHIKEMTFHKIMRGEKA